MVKNGNLRTLKYAFAFTEVACEDLKSTFLQDPKIIRHPQKLFKSLLMNLILSDKAGSHPAVEKLLKVLYDLGVDDTQKI